MKVLKFWEFCTKYNQNIIISCYISEKSTPSSKFSSVCENFFMCLSNKASLQKTKTFSHVKPALESIPAFFQVYRIFSKTSTERSQDLRFVFQSQLISFPNFYRVLSHSEVFLCFVRMPTRVFTISFKLRSLFHESSQNLAKLIAAREFSCETSET